MSLKPLFSVPSRVPIGRDADGRPVMIDRAWLDYLGQQLFYRVGGTNAPTNAELVVDMSDDAGLEELKEAFFKAVDGLGAIPPPREPIQFDDQAPPGAFFAPDPPQDGRIQALEEEVSRLRTVVEGISQGYQL